MNLFLLLQDVVAQVPAPNLMVTENSGRRDVLLAIIAGTVTITVTLGPLFINRWMDKLKEEREAAAEKVATAAREAAASVATKVEGVRVETVEARRAVAKLQVTAEATHEIANHRYDEIREELKTSNANNSRLTNLLMSLNILPPAQPSSDVLAAPNREDPLQRREGDPPAPERTPPKP